MRKTDPRTLLLISFIFFVVGVVAWKIDSTVWILNPLPWIAGGVMWAIAALLTFTKR